MKDFLLLQWGKRGGRTITTTTFIDPRSVHTLHESYVPHQFISRLFFLWHLLDVGKSNSILITSTGCSFSAGKFQNVTIHKSSGRKPCMQLIFRICWIIGYVFNLAIWRYLEQPPIFPPAIFNDLIVFPRNIALLKFFKLKDRLPDFIDFQERSGRCQQGSY